MWALEAYYVAKSDKEIACFLLEQSNQPCMSYMETIRIRRKPCISTESWLMGCQCSYGSIGSACVVVTLLCNGEREPTSDTWRLLKEAAE